MAYPNVEQAVTASGVVTAPPKWLQHFYAIAWTISDITGKDTSTFTLLDPMSGSGTSKAAADVIR